MFLRNIIAFSYIVLLLSGCTGKKTGPGTAADNYARKIPEVKNLLIVGVFGFRAGLYEYNFENKKVSLFWSKDDESVVDLSYSRNMKKAFVLTAFDYGKTGALPFIKNAKIYLFDADSNQMEPIERIGDGVQVFMMWGTDNTFKVIMNSIDLTVATYINQHIQIFNTFGKKLFDEIKTYDITKEGYPNPSERATDFTSYDKNYLLSAVPDSGSKVIYLLNRRTNKKSFILRSNQKLNQALWTANDSLLIFSTINISPENKTLYERNPETSSLYIYSMKGERILKSWNGGGLKNFYAVNNSLVFDDGFADRSSIYFFSFKTFLPYDTLRIKKGCGLRNIPRIPDYK